MDVTATQAARGFSELLDRVEHDGATFTITRAGKPIATVVPATPRSMTLREFLARRALAPPVDDSFADDVARARQELPPLSAEDPWAS